MTDQQHNTDLQPQSSVFYKKIFFILVIAFAFIAVLGAILWYADMTQPPPRPTPSPQQTFSPSAQFIPQGATSLSVKDSLNAFNLPKPFPFFDERNVVQSLRLSIDVSSSSITKAQEKGVAGDQNIINQAQPQNAFLPFLSYRIFGQDKEAIQTAFIEYFKSIGWETEGQSLVFSSDTHSIVTVTLFNNMNQQAIIAALSMR